jgi:hypothetical protein
MSATQQDLDVNPLTATVNDAGLMAWGERAKSGEVHLYRMIVKGNGVYLLSIMWLAGRRLYSWNDTVKPVAMPPAPVRGKANQEAQQIALQGFR